MTATYPAPVFDHLLRLTDRRGTLEHARLDEPLPEHGYCTDDVARVLVVATRDHGPDRTLNGLAGVALRFLNDAQALGGACRNRMDSTGDWVDEPALEDAWGRCIWGLGTAAAHSNVAWTRQSAVMQFERAAQERSVWPRAMAFAALGAAELLAFDAEHRGARALITDYAAAVPAANGDTAWPWPEPRLTYANAVLPEAMIAAGVALDDTTLCRRGLDLLAWLLAFETADGNLSPTPVAGRGPRTPGPVSISSPSRYQRSRTRARVPPPTTPTRSGATASRPQRHGLWATTTRQSRCGTRTPVADTTGCTSTE